MRGMAYIDIQFSTLFICVVVHVLVIIGYLVLTKPASNLGYYTYIITFPLDCNMGVIQ
jgi:hypothetical protein